MRVGELEPGRDNELKVWGEWGYIFGLEKGPNMIEKSPRSHPSISVLRHHFQGRRLEYFTYFNLLPSRYPPVKDYNIASIIIFHSL